MGATEAVAVDGQGRVCGAMSGVVSGQSVWSALCDALAHALPAPVSRELSCKNHPRAGRNDPSPSNRIVRARTIALAAPKAHRSRVSAAVRTRSSSSASSRIASRRTRTSAFPLACCTATSRASGSQSHRDSRANAGSSCAPHARSARRIRGRAHAYGICSNVRMSRPLEAGSAMRVSASIMEQTRQYAPFAMHAASVCSTSARSSAWAWRERVVSPAKRSLPDPLSQRRANGSVRLGERPSR